VIPILFVDHLTPEEIITLEELHHNHPKPAARKRAQIILLNNQNYSISELQPIFNLSRQTLSTVIKRWSNIGLCGLFHQARSGRPRRLSSAQEVTVIEMIHQTPRSLKTVISNIEKKMDMTVSVSMLKQLCKRSGLTWKRIRKSLKSKRDSEAFDASRQQLEGLIERAKQGEIDRVYFDESGFSLTPSIPYAWQPIGETIKRPCSRSKQLNVLGFANHNGQFDSSVFEGSVTTAVVVACVDKFAEQIKRPTALIIDNAPTHTSHEFSAHLERWKGLGLMPIFISPYSPELNKIEIVWRRIKYEWLPFSAYDSYDALKESLFETLSKIGTELVVNFA
jgi:transposase